MGKKCKKKVQWRQLSLNELQQPSGDQEGEDCEEEEEGDSAPHTPTHDPAHPRPYYKPAHNNYYHPHYHRRGAHHNYAYYDRRFDKSCDRGGCPPPPPPPFERFNNKENFRSYENRGPPYDKPYHNSKPFYDRNNYNHYDKSYGRPPHFYGDRNLKFSAGFIERGRRPFRPYGRPGFFPRGFQGHLHDGFHQKGSCGGGGQEDDEDREDSLTEEQQLQQGGVPGGQGDGGERPSQPVHTVMINNEEYTKIQTPRQEVIFKKSSLDRKRDSIDQGSVTGSVTSASGSCSTGEDGESRSPHAPDQVCGDQVSLAGSTEDNSLSVTGDDVTDNTHQDQIFEDPGEIFVGDPGQPPLAGVVMQQAYPGGPMITIPVHWTPFIDPTLIPGETALTPLDPAFTHVIDPKSLPIDPSHILPVQHDASGCPVQVQVKVDSNGVPIQIEPSAFTVNLSSLHNHHHQQKGGDQPPPPPPPPPKGHPDGTSSSSSSSSHHHHQQVTEDLPPEVHHDREPSSQHLQEQEGEVPQDLADDPTTATANSSTQQHLTTTDSAEGDPTDELSAEKPPLLAGETQEERDDTKSPHQREEDSEGEQHHEEEPMDCFEESSKKEEEEEEEEKEEEEEEEDDEEGEKPTHPQSTSTDLALSAQSSSSDDETIMDDNQDDEEVQMIEKDDNSQKEGEKWDKMAIDDQTGEVFRDRNNMAATPSPVPSKVVQEVSASLLTSKKRENRRRQKEEEEEFEEDVVNKESEEVSDDSNDSQYASMSESSSTPTTPAGEPSDNHEVSTPSHTHEDITPTQEYSTPPHAHEDVTNRSPDHHHHHDVTRCPDTSDFLRSQDSCESMTSSDAQEVATSFTDSMEVSRSSDAHHEDVMSPDFQKVMRLADSLESSSQTTQIVCHTSSLREQNNDANTTLTLRLDRMSDMEMDTSTKQEDVSSCSIDAVSRPEEACSLEPVSSVEEVSSLEQVSSTENVLSSLEQVSSIEDVTSVEQVTSMEVDTISEVPSCPVEVSSTDQVTSMDVVINEEQATSVDGDNSIEPANGEEQISHSETVSNSDQPENTEVSRADHIDSTESTTESCVDQVRADQVSNEDVKKSASESTSDTVGPATNQHTERILQGYVMVPILTPYYDPSVLYGYPIVVTDQQQQQQPQHQHQHQHRGYSKRKKKKFQKRHHIDVSSTGGGYLDPQLYTGEPFVATPGGYVVPLDAAASVCQVHGFQYVTPQFHHHHQPHHNPHNHPHDEGFVSVQNSPYLPDTAPEPLNQESSEESNGTKDEDPSTAVFGDLKDKERRQIQEILQERNKVGKSDSTESSDSGVSESEEVPVTESSLEELGESRGQENTHLSSDTSISECEDSTEHQTSPSQTDSDTSIIYSHVEPDSLAASSQGDTLKETNDGTISTHEISVRDDISSAQYEVVNAVLANDNSSQTTKCIDSPELSLNAEQTCAETQVNSNGVFHQLSHTDREEYSGESYKRPTAVESAYSIVEANNDLVPQGCEISCTEGNHCQEEKCYGVCENVVVEGCESKSKESNFVSISKEVSPVDTDFVGHCATLSYQRLETTNVENILETRKDVSVHKSTPNFNDKTVKAEPPKPNTTENSEYVCVPSVNQSKVAVCSETDKPKNTNSVKETTHVQKCSTLTQPCFSKKKESIDYKGGTRKNSIDKGILKDLKVTEAVKRWIREVTPEKAFTLTEQTRICLMADQDIGKEMDTEDQYIEDEIVEPKSINVLDSKNAEGNPFVAASSDAHIMGTESCGKRVALLNVLREDTPDTFEEYDGASTISNLSNDHLYSEPSYSHPVSNSQSFDDDDADKNNPDIYNPAAYAKYYQLGIEVDETTPTATPVPSNNQGSREATPVPGSETVSECGSEDVELIPNKYEIPDTYSMYGGTSPMSLATEILKAEKMLSNMAHITGTQHELQVAEQCFGNPDIYLKHYGTTPHREVNDSGVQSEESSDETEAQSNVGSSGIGSSLASTPAVSPAHRPSGRSLLLPHPLKNLSAGDGPVPCRTVCCAVM